MLACQRELFDLPRDVCFLSAAAYSPLPRPVQQAGNEGVSRKGQPWRIDKAFRGEQNERARAAAARLIGAAPGSVALVPSVSYGFATAAKLLNLPRGQRVIVLQDDHSSPVLEWQTRAETDGIVVETVRQPANGDWTSAVLEAIERPTPEPLGAVSVSIVHWADGGLIDAVAIAEASRKAGAALALDATQAIGALPVDVGEIDPDFVMFPTYKWLLGPYGRAFLYVAPRHHDGIPLEQTTAGRQGIRSEGLVYLDDISYVEDARRFDMGQCDYFITMEMAAVGMELIATWGPDRISERLSALNGRVVDAVANDYAFADSRFRAPHILSIPVQPDSAEPIAQALGSDNIHVTARLGRLRVAPHVYNDETDIDRFVAAFQHHARGA